MTVFVEQFLGAGDDRVDDTGAGVVLVAAAAGRAREDELFAAGALGPPRSGR